MLGAAAVCELEHSQMKQIFDGLLGDDIEASAEKNRSCLSLIALRRRRSCPRSPGSDIVRDLPGRDLGDHDGAGGHVGGTALTFGASGRYLWPR